MKIFGPTNNGPNIGLRNNGNIILVTSTITVSAGYEAQNNQTGIITSSGNSYISNAGIFKNLSGGVIDMVDGNIDCLSNSGNIINRGIWSVHDANYGIINRYGGQILNTGTLEIYNISPGYGIENDNGYILNKGLLNIYNTTEQGIKEIENLSIGSMINDTTGIWIVKSAMLSYGDVSNYGNMQLSAFGEPSLETYGNFYNYDSLTVSINNTYAAIRSHGYFLNDTSAYLLSDKVYYEPPASIPFFLDFFGDFDNHGHLDLHMKNLIKGISFSGDLMQNSGEISVQNVYETAIELFYKTHNTSTGNIFIDSVFVETSIGSPGKGAFIVKDTLINDGDIELWYYADMGFSTVSNAYVLNTGKLEVSNDIGIKTVRPFNLEKGTLVNETNGTIRVLNTNNLDGPIDNPHPAFRNYAVFINKGEMIFSNCHFKNLIQNLSATSPNVSLLHNKGNISVSNCEVQEHGLYTTSEVINDTCASLDIWGDIFIDSFGSLKNYGGLNLYNFSVLNNSGIFFSKGVISGQDHHLLGYFSPLEGILTYPLSHELQSSRTYNAGVLIGSNPYNVGSPIYRKSINTYISIGTYSYAERSITSNIGLLGNTYMTYLSIETPAGCSFYSKIPLLNQSFDCFQIRNSVFTGSNEEWFLPANWSDGQLPDYCSNVTIPSGKRVKIDDKHHVVINKITVETGAVFDSANGSISEIRNEY
ncbi:hypothetical protein EGI22_10445 [Lacihabitans sp. LS3-19]|uniref:hypothetical protein n=1 Tax=Lacihabitans sp. LS3-19 TaxID=2487335 RepID=UPI0020CFBCE6|nr:hypothetical protein [Lacihabitans sp. LS3-19]MCP9768333.1 hypothetical protein [Lacihabitans sp. LS3-19]